MPEILLEWAKNNLSSVGQKMLTENMMILGILLFTVRGHFKRIETKLGELATALINLEKRSSERMDIFEQRLIRVEQPKGDKSA